MLESCNYHFVVAATLSISAPKSMSADTGCSLYSLSMSVLQVVGGLLD